MSILPLDKAACCSDLKSEARGCSDCLRNIDLVDASSHQKEYWIVEPHDIKNFKDGTVSISCSSYLKG